MAHMVRKQIYIETEQDEGLKKLSKLLGISEDEIARMVERSRGVREEWAIARSKLNHESWLKALAIMESLPVTEEDTGYKLPSREEMYDEILKERGLIRR